MNHCRYRLAIHSVPRSGSTWLGELVNSSPATCYKFQPLFSYVMKDYLCESSDSGRIESFFCELESSCDDFLDQTEARKEGTLPTFQKKQATHVVYKEVRYHNLLPNLVSRASSGVRFIFLIRNPLEVLSSWLCAPREFRKDLGWDFQTEWREARAKNQGRPEEYFGYDKWKEAALLFHQLREMYPGRVQVVRYCDLVCDTESVLRNLFAFCGLELTDQTKRFLVNSQSTKRDDTYGVFRSGSMSAKWRDHLPRSVIDSVLSDLQGTSLQMYVERGIDG